MNPAWQHSSDITHFSNVQHESLLNELGSSMQGLSEDVAVNRLRQYGPNTIDITRKIHPILQFLALFLSPLPLLLITLSIISLVTGGVTGALVIAAMVFLSTGLAFLQEYKSNKAAEKLRQLVSIKVTVLRENLEHDILLSDLVPGDLIKLSAGDLIPADLQEIKPLTDITFLQGDFLDESVQDQLQTLVPDKADVVLSDMAAPACGMTDVDHIRIMDLLENVYEFCLVSLKPGGAMVAKVLRGGAESVLLQKLKKSFTKVVHFKPPASRQGSSEMYVVCLGFRKVPE